ncbi:hypothetical protein PO909_007578 [Leuciscus waleckii]
MRVASTVAVTYQKAMTGCLLIALHRVFLRLNRARYIPDPDLRKSVTIAFTNHLTNLKLNVLQKMKDNIGTTSASASEFSINCSHSLSHLFSDDSYDAYELMKHKHFPSGRGNSTKIYVRVLSTRSTLTRINRGRTHDDGHVPDSARPQGNNPGISGACRIRAVSRSDEGPSPGPDDNAVLKCQLVCPYGGSLYHSTDKALSGKFVSRSYP